MELKPVLLVVQQMSLLLTLVSEELYQTDVSGGNWQFQIKFIIIIKIYFEVTIQKLTSFGPLNIQDAD